MAWTAQAAAWGWDQLAGVAESCSFSAGPAPREHHHDLGKEDRVILGGFEEALKLFLRLYGWGSVEFRALPIMSAWARGCSGISHPLGKELQPLSLQAAVKVVSSEHSLGG